MVGLRIWCHMSITVIFDPAPVKISFLKWSGHIILGIFSSTGLVINWTTCFVLTKLKLSRKPKDTQESQKEKWMDKVNIFGYLIYLTLVLVFLSHKKKWENHLKNKQINKQTKKEIIKKQKQGTDLQSISEVKKIASFWSLNRLCKCGIFVIKTSIFNSMMTKLIDDKTVCYSLRQWKNSGKNLKRIVNSYELVTEIVGNYLFRNNWNTNALSLVDLRV